MSEHKRYEIKHVRDMLAIPADKQAAFMADLADWLTVSRKAIPELLAAAEEEGLNLGENPCAGMVWIDDGQRGLSGVILEMEIGIGETAEDHKGAR